MAHHLLTKELEYADLEQLLNLNGDDQINFNHNIELYRGNMWLNGEGNIGIKAAPDDPQAAEIGLKLQQRHISSNKVKEIVLRQRNAIFGVEPNFDFAPRRALKKIEKMIDDPAFVSDPVDPDAPPADPSKPEDKKKPPQIPDPTGIKVLEPPTPEEQKLIDEAREAFLEFWDQRKPLKPLKIALKNRLLTGFGSIRLFVPAKFVRRGEDGKMRAKQPKTLAEAMKMIYVEASDPDSKGITSRVVEDVFSRDQIGITKLKRHQGKNETIDYLEFCFIDDNDRTFIGVFDRSQGTAPGEQSAPTPKALPAPADQSGTAPAQQAAPVSPLPPEVDLSDPLELNGKLTIFEMAGEPLITPSMRRQQFLINHAFTMAGFVMTEAGVSEMALTNVEIETEIVKDKNGKDKEIPKRLKRGGGVVNNFIGIETVTKDGGAALATPGIHFKEPSPVDTMQDGVDLGYAAMLQEANQQYALIAGDATVSGESRVQAISDFFLFSGDFKTDADLCGGWLAETVLYYAAQLCGRAKEFYPIRAMFESKLQVSLPSPDSRRLNIEEMKAGIKSRNRAQMDAGINDPEAENAIIAEEKRADIALMPPALIDANDPNANDPKNPNLPAPGKKTPPKPTKPPTK